MTSRHCIGGKWESSMVTLCVKCTKRSEVNICSLFRAFNLFCATGCIFVNSYCMCAHYYHLIHTDYLIHRYRQIRISDIDIQHKDPTFVLLSLTKFFKLLHFVKNIISLLIFSIVAQFFYYNCTSQKNLRSAKFHNAVATVM